MAFIALAASEVDAESAWDDRVAGKIKDNFDDHESRLLLLKAYPLEWRVNGALNALPSYRSKYKKIDGLRKVVEQTFFKCELMLESPGATPLEVDIRKYRQLSHRILSVLSIFNGNINSIANVAPALATQAIARTTAQISTQSITLFKSALNIQSISQLTEPNPSSPGTVTFRYRYELSGTVDSDWKVGSTITFAGCTAGGNDGSFTIVRINDDGGNNVVVTNGSGVEQIGAAGTCTLRAYSYNFTNPVSTQFAATEVATMASHTSGVSDGAKTIYAINSGGNNIIIFDATGAVQAGVAGTVNVNRWQYSFSTPASSTDFVVGESAKMASHSSGANNGNFRITAVNGGGGNNVEVYNASGVVQGGAAGTVNTNRWIYALATDPSSAFSAGHTAIVASATDANNRGNFTVKEVNRSASNNIIVYNTAGVAQVGAAGTVRHAYHSLKLSADFSTIYSLRSNVEVQGTFYNVNTGDPNESGGAYNDGFFDVVEINRGGGSNFNVVVNNPIGVEQNTPTGRIVTESKSIFSTRPVITFPTIGESAWNNTVNASATTAPVFDGTDGGISEDEETAGISLGLDIVSIPTENKAMPNNRAANLVVQLS